MKGLLIICWFIYFSPVANGQDQRDYAYIDQKVFRIPAAETYTSTALASFMQSNFKTDLEKLRGIYAWVIANISYDTDSMYHINWSMDPDAQISATLRRRRGVCENYAALFTDIARKSGFYAHVVNGYTSLPGTENKAGHSWCAVQLQDEWFLCDPTWDIGNKGNTKYFLVRPVEFIETHMPFDPLWQLLEYPVSEFEFKRGSGIRKDKKFFNFSDSVKAFFQLDSLQQLETSSRRIKQAGIENDRQKNWLAYNQMKIAGIYGEKDMNLYNSAVADLNEANDVFNNYVQYRNSRFMPLKSDAQINALLDDIPGLISSARKKLEQMGQTVENFQYDTGSLLNRLNNLSARVSEQKKFLKIYLSGDVETRAKSFYKNRQ